VNYFFHDEPAKVLANVHELSIVEAVINGRALVPAKIIRFTTNQYGEGISNENTSHMTITYFLRVVGVSPILSEELAHIIPTVHRS